MQLIGKLYRLCPRQANVPRDRHAIRAACQIRCGTVGMIWSVRENLFETEHNLVGREEQGETARAAILTKYSLHKQLEKSLSSLLHVVYYIMSTCHFPNYYTSSTDFVHKKLKYHIIDCIDTSR